MIDSHAHLTHPDFAEDGVGALVTRAEEAGVNRIICIAYDIPSCRETVEAAEKFDSVYAVIGLHPHEADRVDDNDIIRVEEMARHKKVVAIGETGLDFYRDWAKRENQEKLFRASLEIAGRLEKPVVIHDREAHDDVVATLKEHAGRFPGGVMHCFSGDTGLMESVLPLGFYISIPGTITFGKKEGPLHDVVRRCPEDRLLIETDCPWLTPAPHRGKRNEPAYVRFVRDKVAEILGRDPEEIDRLTTENTERLFRLGN